MKKTSLSFTLALALSSAGCGGPKKEESPWSERVKGDIYIAALLSYTGVWAVGTAQEHGIVLALEEINSAGGVNGKTVGLLAADDRGDRLTGTELMTALVERGDVGALIGPSRSVVTLGSGSGELGIAQMAKDHKILVVSPSATSPAIATFNDDGYVFRSTVSDAAQSKISAKIAEREGFNKVYIAQAAGDAASIGQRQVFTTHFEAAKGADSTNYHEFDNTKANYATEFLNKAKQEWSPAVPDAIFLATFTVETATIVNAAATFNWGVGNTAPKWLMVDASKEDKLVQSLSSPTLLREDNAFGTVPNAVGGDYDTFVAAYTAKYQEEVPAYSAQSYDAAYLIAAAMVVASDPTSGEALKTAILKTGPHAGQTGTLTKFRPGQWTGLHEAMKTTGAADYEGASGDQNFDSHGDVSSTIAEWTVKNGNIIWSNRYWTPDGVLVNQ